MTYNVELFRKIRPKIEADDGEWDQTVWGKKVPGCGTSYCAAGWACVESGDTLRWAASNWLRDIPGTQRAWDVESGDAREEIFDRARYLLGLTEEEAEELFDGENDREFMLAKIDHYIEMGELQCSQSS